MASFTDQITQFNPYIKDFSTEGYVTAGMYKQDKYNRNLAKVNSYVESLYGFNVARDVDKQYLHQKIGGFTEGLNKYLSSADFSNDSLVNQVGGYAGQIANDKYVQNAVYSTAKMQKDLGTLDLAKKEGKGYSPANEYKLMQDVNKYMEGDINTPYQSEGYIPAINAEEEITKTWKDKHPNSRLEKRIGLDGTSGWVMVTEQGEKAISADQVMQDIESTIDPRIRKQINIDANYKLAGVNMDEFVTSQYKDYQDYLNENIESLANKIQTATGPNKKTLEDELTKYKLRREETLNDMKKTLDLSRKNPDAVKDQLYYRQWLKGMSSKISYNELSYSNLIYKDYYDIQKGYYDSIKASKGEKPANSGSTGPMVEIPFKKDEMEGTSLEGLKTEVLTQKEELTQQWNQIASKLLADTYDASGLTADADQIRKANQILYYDKEGKFVTPQTYDKLTPEQKKAYIKGNVAKNQIWKEGQATDIFTIKNKAVLDGLYRQLRADYDNGKQVPISVKEYFDSNLPIEIENAAKAKAVSEIETQLKREGLDVNDFPKIIAEQNRLKGYDDKLAPFTGLFPGVSTFGAKPAILTDPAYTAKVKEREKREGELVRNYQGLQNRREIVLEKGNAEDEKNINQLITAIAAINQESGQDKFKGIDWKKVNEFIDAKETTGFSYGQEPDGSAYAVVSNGGKRIKIPLDKITAQTMSLYEEDPLRVHKNIMALKGGTMGTSPLDAVPINFGGKYKASLLLDKLPSGNYQVQMYIGAGANSGQLKFKDEGKSYTEPELRQLLQSVNDGAIENYIKHLQAVEETRIGKRTGKDAVEFNPDIKPFNIVSNSLQIPNFGGAMTLPSFPGTNQ